MHRSAFRTVVLGAALATLACSARAPAKKEKPKPLSVLEVGRVDADLSQHDPAGTYWEAAREWSVTLMAQPMIAPRPEVTTTEAVIVQAVHDGKRIAFRLRWKDPEVSEAGRLGEFSDALALEFPLREGPLPPVMMGAKGMPVHLFHWRAQYQRDKERGKPTVKELYPNQSVDMYPHEYKEAPCNDPAAAEKYCPSAAEGNPQSYQKTGVDELIAEGFSTSSVQEGRGAGARGVWRNGEWVLVIGRPLAIAGGSTLKPGGSSNVAFAVWQGGKGEVGSRKCVTMQWYLVKVM
jgi:hypothetical protein